MEDEALTLVRYLEKIRILNCCMLFLALSKYCLSCNHTKCTESFTINKPFITYWKIRCQCYTCRYIKLLNKCSTVTVYQYQFLANMPEKKHNKASKYFKMGYYLELSFQKTNGGGGQ